MDLLASVPMGLPSPKDEETVGAEAKESRPRFDSFSTMAPGSSSMSYSESPVLSFCEAGLDEFANASWSINAPFMLPAAESPENDVLEEMQEDDPVSRVNSPAHKVPRLAGGYQPAVYGVVTASTQPVADAMVNMRDAAGAPASPTTPRATKFQLGAPESPPTTPRVTKPQLRAPESPRTPRTMPLIRGNTPPPLVQQSHFPRPPLLQALQKHSVDDVREVLKDDPGAAKEPFWHLRCEPPICFAVRERCSTAIIELLLQNGAETDATDVKGQTPAQIANQRLPREAAGAYPMNLEQAFIPMMPGFDQLTFPFGFGGPAPYPAAQGVWHGEVTHLLEAAAAGA